MSIIVLIILVLLSAFFSGAEIALMSISKLKVKYLVEQKKKNATILDHLKENPHRLLTTILIANNTANIAASALATSLAMNTFSDYGISIAIGVMTLVILIFGEIIPKAYCVRHAVTISLLVAPLILIATYIFYPLTVMTDFIYHAINKLNPVIKEPLITEEELRTIIKVGEGEGSIKTEAGDMIQSIFRMDDISVQQIMTPQPDMYLLDWSCKISDVIQDIIQKEYSRIPVFDKRVDKTRGVVHVKDILRCLSVNKSDLALKEIMKPVHFVPENMYIDSLLRLFKQNKVHLAMVIDEYGGIQGLVTIEDILEELVGEIYDETDVPEALVTKIDAHSARVAGKADIDEVNEHLGLNLEKSGDYETISGLILFKLGRFPVQGEQVEIDNASIRIEKIEDNRIKEVTIIIKER